MEMGRLKMKKSILANVILWGKKIGAVLLDDETKIASFEYDPLFVKNSNVEPSPFKMTRTNQIYSFPNADFGSFEGLPGMLADSLPDRFGNALIDNWLARSGRSLDSFTVIERLSYIGKRGMGALEFEPAGCEEFSRVDDNIAVSELVQFASEVLTNKTELSGSLSGSKEKEDSIKKLLLIGTSAGGARAKVLIAYNKQTKEVKSGQIQCPEGFEYYLLKLDGVEEDKDNELTTPKGFGKIEYSYYQMAIDCKIEMTECDLIHEGGRSHFYTKRFDRVDGQKLHMQTLCALRHLGYKMPRAHGYEQAILTIKEIVKYGQKSDLEQLYRRAVFNVIARNQDDHTKNISFLMNKEGEWSLSPAYDMTYSYNPSGPWTKAHQMTIGGKSDHFTVSDLVKLGELAELSERVSKNIIVDITNVVSNAQAYLDNNKTPHHLRDEVLSNLRLDLK
jgi:serine/threonine-protein kinase HipA